tara:strand:- start:410 stop:1042 length:633 start_codon:yes stop_codon:yes gene_type:complete
MKKTTNTLVLSIFIITTILLSTNKKETNPGVKVQNPSMTFITPISEEVHCEKLDTIQMVFKKYEKDAQLYLDREHFKGTPLSGKLLRECAKKTYDSTGIIVPLELALSQAQWESGMGLKGRSPKNNPYNIGEWNTLGITTMTFSSTKHGVQSYYNLIAKKYLKERSVKELFKDFIDLNGHRYASSKLYEKDISKQYYYIVRWIEKNDTIL